MIKGRVRLAASFLFSATLLLSCGAGESGPAKSLQGHWLILCPDHQLRSLRQREVYGRHQDSLVALYGLKLITLSADGGFWEMDSLHKPAGKWLFTPDSLLKIREAGKGFNPFNTAYTSLTNGELRLTQYLPLENERIKLVWHLKKVPDDSAAARLFSPEANAWRQTPTAPEARPVLQKRLAAMLNYYADYFAFMDKEARYFSPARVLLPFRYYQHAVGLKAEMPAAFARLFYSPQQATDAYGLLERGLAGLKGQYPYDKNFVAEYSRFFRKLADWLLHDLSGR